MGSSPTHGTIRRPAYAGLLMASHSIASLLMASHSIASLLMASHSIASRCRDYAVIVPVAGCRGEVRSEAQNADGHSTHPTFMGATAGKPFDVSNTGSSGIEDMAANR
ncbi:MAG: hypothetical protein WCX61_02850 [Candidatus Peribacteraceae bacterium]